MRARWTYTPLETHLVLNVTGYYGPADGTGLSYFPADYEQNIIADGGTPTAATTDRAILAGLLTGSDIPGSAFAYQVETRVVPTDTTNGLGFLTLWPADVSRPGVSTLNSLAPRVYGAGNGATVPGQSVASPLTEGATKAPGSFFVYLLGSGYLKLDGFGWFNRSR
jgi:hypothetical protein